MKKSRKELKKKSTILIYSDDIPRYFDTLKDFCDTFGEKVNTFYKKDFPIEYKGKYLWKLEI